MLSLTDAGKMIQNFRNNYLILPSQYIFLIFFESTITQVLGNK